MLSARAVAPRGKDREACVLALGLGLDRRGRLRARARGRGLTEKQNTEKMQQTFKKKYKNYISKIIK